MSAVPYESFTSPRSPVGLAPTRDRVVAGVVAAACLALLLLASMLRPDARGHGTHQQLGLPPCGFVLVTGKPCMTCGMTTAFAHATNGHPVRAFITQPAGALLALGFAGVGVLCAWTAATGARLGHWALKLVRPTTLWIVAGIWLAAWAYKWVTW